MSISQTQIRDHNIATVAAAALVGRPNEIAYVAALNSHFYYTIDAAAVVDGTGTLTALGTNAVWKIVGGASVTNNFNAAVAPTANDASPTYSIGSVWIDTLLNQTYVCVDSTPTLAIWHQTDASSFQNNLTATVAPTATADSAAGYSVGSLWIDVTANNSYVCLDSTASAAVWKQTSNDVLNNYTTAGNPTATNDSTQGYSVGSTWVNTFSGVPFTCVDATATAAVWEQLSMNVQPTGANSTKELQVADGAAIMLGIVPKVKILSTTAATTIATPTGLTIGRDYRFTLVGGVQATFTFPAIFVDSNGAAIPPVTVPATTDQVVYDFGARQVGGATVLMLKDMTTGGSAAADRVFETIVQTAHGFVVGDAIAYSGGTWVKAVSTTAGPSAQGIVTSVVDANNFVVTTFGNVTATAHGLTVGNYYWLDQTTAGLITATQQTSGITQSVLYVRDANTLFIDVLQPTSVSAATILNNYAATAAPTVTDDTTAGYSVGSEWIDVTANQTYVCSDVTAGAAVWTSMTAGPTGTSLDFASIIKTSTALQTITANTDIVLPVAATGVVISDANGLISGNTFVIKNAGMYAVNSMLSMQTDASPLLFGIYVNGTLLVDSKQMIASTRTNRIISYEGLLSVGDVVSFRYSGTISYAKANFYVRQLSTTAMTVSPSYTPWMTYTPTFGNATSTNPTGAVISAMYKVTGKSLSIAFHYDQMAGTTGVANGTGNYVLSLPPGYNIDTSVVPVATGAVSTGHIGIPVGSGMQMASAIGGALNAFVSSATAIAFSVMQTSNSYVQLDAGAAPLTRTQFNLNATIEVPIV